MSASPARAADWSSDDEPMFFDSNGMTQLLGDLTDKEWCRPVNVAPLLEGHHGIFAMADATIFLQISSA